MESVLRLKVRAIGTGAGSWKPNWEGAGAGAGVGSWGALSFFLPQVHNLGILRTGSKYIYLTLRSNELKSQKDIE